MIGAGVTTQHALVAGAPPARPVFARPHPWLAPAIGLIVGVSAAECVPGLAICSAGWLLLATALLATGVGLAMHCGSRVGTLVMLAGLAATAGVARYQLSYDRPPHHIVHVLEAEPILTRLAGRVVTTPVEQPPLLLNPFLSLEPAVRTVFVIRVDELRTEEQPRAACGYVRVRAEGIVPDVRAGQRLELTGRLFRPFGPQNPGEPDWSAWYRHQGIDAGLAVNGGAYIRVLADPVPARWRLATRVRTAVQSLLFESYASAPGDPAVSLLDTMVLGQRTAADRQLNEAFLRAGGLHFLAVSGFNVNVLALTTAGLVRLLRGGRGLAAGASMVVILLFGLMTELDAPVLRAEIVAVIATVAVLLRRPLCHLNWLAAAVAVVLLCNPRELFRPGFQLTFVQVLALLTVVPRGWRELWGRRADPEPPREADSLAGVIVSWFKRAAVAGVLVAFCAWAIATPLVLLHFGRFAPWGLVGSVVLAPLVTGIVVLSFLVVLLNLALPPIGAAAGWLLALLTRCLLWAVGLFEDLPGAVLEFGAPPVWFVLGTYATALWLLRARTRDAPLSQAGGAGTLATAQRGSRRAWLGSAVAVCVAVAWGAWLAGLRWTAPTDVTLHVLSVGNGSLLLLAGKQGQCAVLDAGTDTNSAVGELLHRVRVALRLDEPELLVISHANFDHYSGVPELLARRDIPWYSSGYFERGDAEALSTFRRLVPQEYTSRRSIFSGARLRAAETDLEVLWPPPGLGAEWPVNDTSLVLRLRTGGRTVLLPGDLEAAGLAALLEAERRGELALRADVLVAPHHGEVLRSLTAEFIAAVSPEVIIASTRTPRPQLTATAAEVLGPCARVLLTGEVGAVAVGLRAGRMLEVRTPFAAR